jgi:hypothetical protein
VYGTDFKKCCLINLINIMVFLLQEKLVGFPLGWNGKYGAVQLEGREWATVLDYLAK